MTKEEIQIAQAAYCVGKTWEVYEGTEDFDHMVGLRVKHLIELVRNYHQSSLPSNLDEAAEKSYKEYDVKTAVKPKEHPVGFLFFDGFKAGAEWKAGQGITIEGEVVSTDENRTSIRYTTPCHPTYHDYIYIKPIDCTKGDKVEVQIRKK